ncbi:GTPase Era [Chondromyces crocatus]|uniref:GTPase Era n=1 Tax=Chondromyces crocatus TaxID=52 RepID=A0A0K1EQL8_CHOCO|nr:GTPase Era [Chondromyces crocatus]AKT43225.1 uncharacterized protein CMC5_074560 [Chondromyces crocatus]
MPEGPQRSGRVALLGRPNVGKSTLLNAALGHPLAIVSPTPQTTRDAILGVTHHGSAELILLDTPGLHRPLTELGRAMNDAAREAARSADVVLFMVEVPQVQGDKPRLPRPHPGDVTLLADLAPETIVILVLNKIDRIHDKRLLLPLMSAFGQLREFTAIVPLSALKKDGVAHVLDEVARHLPEAPWQHGAEEMTDRPTRFFAAEYVREQILRATKAEVPHACAVHIDRFFEPAGGGVVHIDATIHVERPGQKAIIIGAGAEMLKRIGTQARGRIEELVGRQVNLKLWVRISPDWRKSSRELQQLGYRDATGGASATGGTLLFANLPDDIEAPQGDEVDLDAPEEDDGLESEQIEIDEDETDDDSALSPQGDEADADSDDESGDSDEADEPAAEENQ